MADVGFSVDSRHSGELLRLGRIIEPPGHFRLVLAEFGDSVYRERLLDYLDRQYPQAARWTVPEGLAPAEFEAHLAGMAAAHDPIHLLGLEAWWDSLGGDGLKALNYRREPLAAAIPSTLVLWLGSEGISRFARGAPDLWAWRTAVLDFLMPSSGGSGPVFEHTLAPDRADADRVTARIGEIATYLDALQRPPGVAEAGLYLERAELESQLGQLDDALTDAGLAHEIHLAEGNQYEAAVAAGVRADIVAVLGDFDQALHIRRKEQLPVYEKLGDLRAKAVTLGKVADILQTRGDRGQALRIYQEQLPIYEQLGDVRERAVTLGKVADILQDWGQLDEALRMYREEELPVYEKLGDLRSQAATKCRMADILQARGELNGALRILEEEVQPVFEKLGDLRSRAVILGRKADILQVLGELDEAQRIRREEELPVYEKLGDLRSLLTGRANIAVGYLQRGQGNDRGQANKLLCLALGDAQRLRLPEAGQIQEILTREGMYCA